jgi:nucleotide-binding universal stress UspA family protein
VYKRILVPLDGSALAEEALPHALEIGRCINSRLWLLQVILAYPSVVDVFYTAETLKQAEGTAHRYLDDAAARLNYDHGSIAVQVLVGPVAENIIDFAKETDIDLIVMSTHGFSGLSRWVYGSVADKILRGALCPTLIVRHSRAG